ncbi:hypothetical protein LX36DRAFT_599229 [Colletotrichum falcatum]|nr:hypothetical protein LX36DRAFT_599229 [Colletotrichum falcatum]
MAAAAMMAYYPYDDMSIDQAKRDYLKQLADFGAEQNLHEDLRSYVRAVTIAFTVLAGIVVGLRFVARHLQGAKYLIDDYTMLAAMVLLVGNMVMNLVLVDGGIGLHSGRLTLEQIQFLDRIMIGAEILYVNGVNMYKVALLLLYLRIFPMRQVRKGAIICGSLTTGWTLACVVAASIQCIPITKVWEPWKTGFCINLFLTQLCIAIPSIMVDIAILYLPIPHVLRLQMGRGQRVLVLLTFLLGSYVVFCSVYRFRIFLLYTRDDVPYSLAQGLAWNIIEISSGIVSACLPTMGPIVRLLWKGLLESASRSGLEKYARSLSTTNKKSGSRSANVTIGGGQRSGTGSHANEGSKEWSKAAAAEHGGKAGRPNNNLREEAKYGIGLRTMGASDDDRSSRSSNEVQITAQRSVSVTIKSPGAASFQEREHNISARDYYHGKRHTRQMSSSNFSHPTNMIWQHREIEITTEPVEPESMIPEASSKRRSVLQ